MAQTQSSKAVGVFTYLPLFFTHFFAGFVCIVATLYIGYYHCDFIPVPASTDLIHRLAFALQCTLPMVVVVFVAILMVMNKRGFTKAVDPLSGNESILQLDKNVLWNTLEQFVIGFSLLLIASTVFKTTEQLKLIPIYSFLFVFGRIAFRVGYGISSKHRAFGMSMNLHIVGFMLIYLFYLFLTGDIFAGTLSRDEL